MGPSVVHLKQSFIASNLNLYATDGDICSLCDYAITNAIESILVYPTSVSLCSNILYDSKVQVDCAIAFPHGRSTLASKLAEIKEVSKQGADAVTTFLNYSALRSGEKNLINQEIEEISKLTKKLNLKITFAVEASILKQKYLIHAIKTCVNHNADGFLTSYGSSFSECCSHLNEIPESLKSELNIISYIEKLSKRESEKLLKLGARKLIISGHLKNLN